MRKALALTVGTLLAFSSLQALAAGTLVFDSRNVLVGATSSGGGILRQVGTDWVTIACPSTLGFCNAALERFSIFLYSTTNCTGQAYFSDSIPHAAYVFDFKSAGQVISTGELVYPSAPYTTKIIKSVRYTPTAISPVIKGGTCESYEPPMTLVVGIPKIIALPKFTPPFTVR